jgi:hypothetical protein
MKWRVVLELVGADGTAAVHEISDGAAVAEYTPRMIGLTFAEGKDMLAAVQRHLVEAQMEDHCRRPRRCQRCGMQLDPSTRNPTGHSSHLETFNADRHKSWLAHLPHDRLGRIRSTAHEIGSPIPNVKCFLAAKNSRTERRLLAEQR